MNKLITAIADSELLEFAYQAHTARFPAFAWKAVACDMMGLPMGSRPTPAQIVSQPHMWSTLWLELTLRFDQMTTVQWAEYIENEEERIHNALVYLGRTPDKVNERLTLMGVIGDAMGQYGCPLGRYFNGVYGAWFTQTYRSDSYVDFVKVNNPHTIQQFVHEFDDGLRPNLDMFADREQAL